MRWDQTAIAHERARQPTPPAPHKAPVISKEGAMSRPRILYIAHDLDDAAIWRRRTMLREGGAELDLIGFRRLQGPLPAPAIVLGQTSNARMGQRLWAVARARARLSGVLRQLKPPDIILARNLETLPLAHAAARWFASHAPPRVVYEVLDIHRLMLRDNIIGRSLRLAERWLLRRTDLVLVSSPAFLREYFSAIQIAPSAVHLIENRVVSDEAAAVTRPYATRQARQDAPLVIGWFGILRCKTSLHCLDAATRAAPGRLRVVLRGRPALDEIPDFDAIVAANPDLIYGGPYQYPDDIFQIYSEIDLAWLIDRYDTGRNSDWLMPNRFYESGLAGVPPIGLAGTEVAQEMTRRQIGVLLESVAPNAIVQTLASLTRTRLAELRRAQKQVPSSTWRAGGADARALVHTLLGRGAVPVSSNEVRVP